jgi:8-oxo-dGTP pyrophosphatase MutT (NUDIX family)
VNDQPATPVYASTAMLLRDGADGLEVLMVVRHDEIDFAAGAAVFPGGKLDPGDADPSLRPRLRNIDGLDDLQVSLRVGAIREIFEECGMLLAHPSGSDDFVDHDRVERLLETYRIPLEQNELTMAEFAAREDLDLACGNLVHFAHWITPTGRPKRFDTHFYVAIAPELQIAAHDGREAVDSIWITPSQALAEYEAGTRTVIFPTRLNLEKLGRDRHSADAMTTARDGTVVTVLPQVAKTPSGRVIQIPKEAGYIGHEFDFDLIANENKIKG